MAARKPRIVYSWVTIRPPRAAVRVECIWSLLGANGEHMCSSFPEGYRDKRDARRAVYAVAAALQGESDPAAVGVYAREVGPGPKPEA